MDLALELGAIDSGSDSIRLAVDEADLIVVCTPVGSFEHIFREMAPHLTHGAVVTDVGSTKRSVLELSRAVLPAHTRFVGSHPMAGGERRGVEFARADLFKGAVCVTTPTATTDPNALASVEEFWTDLGMQVIRTSPEAHDQLVGSISHLPHALAAALVRLQPEEAIALAGKGFLDATRIAAGDPGLWRDILLDNSNNVRKSIERLEGELVKLKSLLDSKDANELQAWLASAAAAREKLSRS